MNGVDLIVRGGTVVTATGTRQADISIVGDVIASIAAPGQDVRGARETFEARGLYVLPGLIDAHVHFREPGLESKEDWASGTAAAVFGGVTTVIDMPNTLPPTDSVRRAMEKTALASGRAWCDYAVFGLLGQDNLEDALELVASDLVVGLKAYLGATTGGLPPPDDETLRRVLTAARSAGVRVAFHAEDDEMIRTSTAELRRAGRRDARAFAESRPPAAEVAAINRIGRLALDVGAPVHACHLSSEAGLAAITAWRGAGVDFSCEVTAHHCFLSTRDLVQIGSLARVNPPLRELGNGAALLAALADGRIDTIASDHAPHELPDKQQDDIWAAASGFAGVETTPPLFLTYAVRTGLMSLSRFVDAASTRPARLWGLWPRKGQIEVGTDADLAVVELGREGRIRARDLHGRNNHTPFEGWRTEASVVATVLRGRIVMREGKLSGPPSGVYIGRRDLRQPLSAEVSI